MDLVKPKVIWITQKRKKMAFDPPLGQDFIEKMERRQKEKAVKVADFKKRYGL